MVIFGILKQRMDNILEEIAEIGAWEHLGTSPLDPWVEVMWKREVRRPLEERMVRTSYFIGI